MQNTMLLCHYDGVNTKAGSFLPLRVLFYAWRKIEGMKKK
jgi:hypothetical protein